MATIRKRKTNYVQIIGPSGTKNPRSDLMVSDYNLRLSNFNEIIVKVLGAKSVFIFNKSYNGNITNVNDSSWEYHSSSKLHIFQN